MEQLLDLIKTIGGPAATVICCLFFALKWMERREHRCDERLAEIQRVHTSYVEQQTRTVTQALVENTQSNNAVSDSTRELTQALTGHHRIISKPN